MFSQSLLNEQLKEERMKYRGTLVWYLLFPPFPKSPSSSVTFYGLSRVKMDCLCFRPENMLINALQTCYVSTLLFESPFWKDVFCVSLSLSDDIVFFNWILRYQLWTQYCFIFPWVLFIDQTNYFLNLWLAPCKHFWK